MKSLNLTKAEIENMSYDDVAYIILENNQNKMKIQDLFKEVIKLMEIKENVFEEHLADFFELLSTDKRFIMLEKGYWDLKVNHATKIVIDDEDDDEIIEIDDVPKDTENEEIDFDEETIDDDDTEDDLKDLVILDENEEETI